MCSALKDHFAKSICVLTNVQSYYTFCLQTFQLRVDDQKCPTANHPITEWGREKEEIVIYPHNLHKLAHLHITTVCLEEVVIRTLLSLSMSEIMAMG